jgi:hypothetical protein
MKPKFQEGSMKRFIPATIFGIAFGFLEAIVVVYLRKIYYPTGFSFPLVLLEPQMIKIEIIREFATIVMLATLGWILGKNLGEKFSFFIFTFAVWDIFYYIALKLFLDWPESLLTWDVLFLIPITWIGPVLAPVICSIGMIIIALVYVYLKENNYKLEFYLWQSLIIAIGVLVIIYSFIFDYFHLITNNGWWDELGTITENQEFWNVVRSYIPEKFNWSLFSIGCLLIAAGYGYTFFNGIKSKNRNGNES